MKTLLVPCVALGLLALAGCKQDKGGSDSMGSMSMSRGDAMSFQATTKPAMMYTCTMHPEVVSDKPGTCPKCGMTLVPKK